MTKILFLLLLSIQLQAQPLRWYTVSQLNNDNDAQNIINALAVTNIDIQQAIIKFVTDRKTFNGTGYWTKIKAIYPFYGTTATMQKWNWKDPQDLDGSYRLTFVNDASNCHTDTGYIMTSGSNQYANTHFVPSAILNNDNMFALGLLPSKINYLSNGMILGAAGGGGNIFLSPTFSNAVANFGGAQTTFVVPNGDFRGIFGFNRQSNSSLKIVLDLVKMNEYITSSASSLPNSSIAIGAWNNGGTLNFYYTRSPIQFVSFGASLTDAEYVDYIKGIWTLMKGLGKRQDALFFGNSITVGIHATPSSMRWTSQFCASKGYIEYNKGASGTTMESTTPLNPANPPNMYDRCDAEVPLFTDRYAKIFYAYATNDIGFNFPNYTSANFRNQYDTVLRKTISIKGWAGYNVVLMDQTFSCEVPNCFDAYVTNYSVPVAADTARRHDFRNQVKALSVKFGTLYVPIYDAMKVDLGNAGCDDCLHPNNTGYTYIKNKVLGVVKN
jgi:lysophospholipase L1-like esterase